MYIGIRSDVLNKRFAMQRNGMWCWAASLQMIFQYYGIRISQEEIVHRTFGRTQWGMLPNKPGDFIDITNWLNTYGVDANGIHYQVRSHALPTAPTPALLFEELRAKRPLLLAYQSRPRMNHAVVVTGIEILTYGSQTILNKVVLRDPSPYPQNIARRGRREERPSVILPKCSAVWMIRVVTS